MFTKPAIICICGPPQKGRLYPAPTAPAVSYTDNACPPAHATSRTRSVEVNLMPSRALEPPTAPPGAGLVEPRGPRPPPSLTLAFRRGDLIRPAETHWRWRRPHVGQAFRRITDPPAVSNNRYRNLPGVTKSSGKRPRLLAKVPLGASSGPLRISRIQTFEWGKKDLFSTASPGVSIVKRASTSEGCKVEGRRHSAPWPCHRS